MPEIPQRSFTGGELDPALHARSDLTKYRNGLATLRNFKIHPQGGVSNREGFEYIEEIKDSSQVSRLIAFEFNKDQAYVLEFGNLYMRVYKDGGLVLETADTITGATNANPVVLTVANTLSNNTFRWTPQTSCSSVAVRLLASKKLSGSDSEYERSALYKKPVSKASRTLPARCHT